MLHFTPSVSFPPGPSKSSELRMIVWHSPCIAEVFAMRYSMRCAILLVLSVLLSRLTSAQSIYGTIQGALTLGTGTPASKALVQVSSLDQGTLQMFSAQTDESGYFILSNLPLGNYKVRMQIDGYKTHEEPLINVAADSPIQINVKLIQGDRTVTEVGDGSAVSILKLDR